MLHLNEGALTLNITSNANSILLIDIDKNNFTISALTN